MRLHEMLCLSRLGGPLGCRGRAICQVGLLLCIESLLTCVIRGTLVGGEGATWLESSGLRTTFTKCFTLGLSADLGGRLHGRFLSRLLCGRCCEFQRGFGCRLTGLARLGRIGMRNAFAWRLDKIVKYDFHGLLRGVCAIQIFLLLAARLCPSTLRLAF